MDKVLAFSILSASPADLAAGGRWARLSWRRGADDRQGEPPARQERGGKADGARPHGGGENKKAAEAPRFALELDGIDCFETIVSH
ncbi:hypothetical protein ACP4OV_017266 [Aristida adscensionis]